MQKCSNGTDGVREEQHDRKKKKQLKAGMFAESNSCSDTKALQRQYVSILHGVTRSSLPLALGESFI